LIVLFGYHVAFQPVVLEHPVEAYGTFLLAWFTGAGIRLVLLAAKPWAPVFVGVFSTIYRHANMIA